MTRFDLESGRKTGGQANHRKRKGSLNCQELTEANTGLISKNEARKAEADDENAYAPLVSKQEVPGLGFCLC